MGVQGNFARKDRTERGAKVSDDEVYVGARLIVGRLLRRHEHLDICRAFQSDGREPSKEQARATKFHIGLLLLGAHSNQLHDPKDRENLSQE